VERDYNCQLAKKTLWNEAQAKIQTIILEKMDA
jgi:hypothetical protein